MTCFETMIDDLYNVILTVDNKNDLKNLFDDLCTDKEIENMASRLRAAVLLMNGETYSEIIEETGISSTTLSRISKCLRRGSGGYTKVVPSALPDKFKKED